MEHFLISIGLPASLVSALKLASLGRLILASLLGATVGLERELAGKPAGLRTTLLICVGAAMFTELSLSIAFLAQGNGDALRADPARLAAQIIPGIGFIGAGAILHGRGRVTGLTTAATLWVVTAIGIAVGAGAYVEAIGTTILVLATLLLLRRVEGLIRRRLSHRRYTAAMDPETDAFEELVERLKSRKVVLKVESMEKVGNEVEVTFRLAGPQHEHDSLVKHMLREKGIRRFTRN
ncbi:MAG TPA: MgtC/SapB family protein [Longimicrobium sp.]|nr:MgtC/SapB family protein [Longimicrobium sp.]